MHEEGKTNRDHSNIVLKKTRRFLFVDFEIKISSVQGSIFGFCLHT